MFLKISYLTIYIPVLHALEEYLHNVPKYIHGNENEYSYPNCKPPGYSQSSLSWYVVDTDRYLSKARIHYISLSTVTALSC